MARYDKYTGVAGGFRVESATTQAEANYDRPIGVGVDANGLGHVKSAQQSGFVGVTVVDRTKRRTGDILDVMTAGEIVDCEGLTAGTTYYLDGAGELTATAPAAGVNGVKVGHTVEAWRLVVRVEGTQG